MAADNLYGSLLGDLGRSLFSKAQTREVPGISFLSSDSKCEMKKIHAFSKVALMIDFNNMIEIDTTCRDQVLERPMSVHKSLADVSTPQCLMERWMQLQDA